MCGLLFATPCTEVVVYVHDVQKTNRDFLNPLLISLTYDLEDIGDPTMSLTGDGLPVDLNQFPVVDKHYSATNISVCILGRCYTSLPVIF